MTATAGTPENLNCFANSDLFEMRVYHTNPDRGDKIYFIHCLLWVSLPETTKSEACRNAICYLFCKTVLFSLSVFKRRTHSWRCAYESRQPTWRRVRTLIQSGPDKCLHTHQHSVAACPRRCQTRWCGKKLEESSLLATTKLGSPKNSHARTRIHTYEYTGAIVTHAL